jgi:RNase P subunit RPR2
MVQFLNTTDRIVLKCGKCGWQQSYPYSPDWTEQHSHWRDCHECGSRGTVTKRKEKNRR